MLAEPLGLTYCEIEWARGLLQPWAGDVELAVRSIKGALALAREGEDRWREYKCLTWLATIELEGGRSADACAHCAELLQVARKLGDADVPLAMTLNALAQLSSGEDRDERKLVAALRAIDDKSHLAYALNAAAALCLVMDRTDAAHSYAREVLNIAEVMQRTNDQVIAHATLMRLSRNDRNAGEEPDSTGAWPAQDTFDERDLSTRARSALLEAMRAAGHRPMFFQR